MQEIKNKIDDLRNQLKTLQNLDSASPEDFKNPSEILNKLNDELDNFSKVENVKTPEADLIKKDKFYYHWLMRYRKVFSFSFLGQKGVIAIPNTTFEEWLVWFNELFSKFLDNYNDFKESTFQAITEHEKHLRLHDRQIDELIHHIQEIYTMLEDHETRLRVLETHIQKLQKELDNLTNRVTQNENNIQNIQNDMRRIEQKTDGQGQELNKIIQNLTESGAYNGQNFNGHIAYGNINLFSETIDGNLYIRTNNGHSEGDISAGV